MEVNYDDIAPGYDAHRRGRGPYFARLAALASGAHQVLEVGAGTGNNTRAMIDAQPCRITALEHSKGMLARGRVKVPEAAWLRGDATRLPFAEASFDCIFGTYMLHHIRDLGALFGECRRVLRPGGLAVFVTVPEGFIAAHPMNAYFPSFAKVDLARFQPIGEVEAAMRTAGLVEVRSENTIDSPRPIDADYAERVAGKFISTYALLPKEEFNSGVARLRRDVMTPGGTGATIAREATLVTGSRG